MQAAVSEASYSDGADKEAWGESWDRPLPSDWCGLAEEWLIAKTRSGGGLFVEVSLLLTMPFVLSVSL